MRAVSATEAKNRLGALIGEVARGQGEVVIEHHGRPRAVIISAEEWEQIAAMREQLKRLEAWQRIREIAAEAAERNADLSAEEADALAMELAREARRRVAQRFRQR